MTKKLSELTATNTTAPTDIVEITRDPTGVPATYSQAVNRLRGSYSGADTIPADAGAAYDFSKAVLYVRDNLDATWLELFRKDGSNQFVFGSDNTTWNGGTILQGPTATLLETTTATAADRTSLVFAQAGATMSCTNASNNTIVTQRTNIRKGGTLPAVGYGSRDLWQLANASSAIKDAFAIDVHWSNATGAAEASVADLYTRTGGAALTRTLRLYASGGIGVGNSGTIGDPGNGGICLPITNGLYINSGGTNYTALGVFGGSTMVFGSGAFNMQLAAYSIAISAGQGMSLSNGWLSLAAGVGLRTVPTTAVPSAGVYTIPANQYRTRFTAVSGTVTCNLPAHVDGKRVLVSVDSSGSVVNKVVLTPTSGTINGAATNTLDAAYATRELESDGTNWFVLNSHN